MKKFSVMLLGLFLAGCATFNAERAPNEKIYTPTSPEVVEILDEAPSRPYIVIGEVRAEGETFAMPESMKERMKEQAANMGGEAIIIDVKVKPYRMKDAGVAVGPAYGVDLSKTVSKKMVGQVIRYEK